MGSGRGREAAMLGGGVEGRGDWVAYKVRPKDRYDSHIMTRMVNKKYFMDTIIDIQINIWLQTNSLEHVEHVSIHC